MMECLVNNSFGFVEFVWFTVGIVILLTIFK